MKMSSPPLCSLKNMRVSGIVEMTPRNPCVSGESGTQSPISFVKPPVPSTWVNSPVSASSFCVTGEHEDARRAARRARELDPVAPTLWLNEVLILVATGHIPEAHTTATEFAGFHRDCSASAFALGMVGEALGDHDEAAESFVRAVELGGGPHSTAARGANLVRAGRSEPARQLLAEMLAIGDRCVPPTSIARIHAALDETEEAFRWLDRAAAVRDDWLPFMDGWPRFDGIRADPRFAALRRRIGLPAVRDEPGPSRPADA